ncbi:alpha/beta-hydrolase [Mycena crocata]|nr:alpha/beta-hydrolase [Mycena crocata]
MAALTQETKTAPYYGRWNSPISSLMIAKMSVSTEDVLVDCATSAIYRIEKRPLEGGRNVIVSLTDGLDVFGEGWNARTAVHEYGGAPAVVHDNVVIFSNLSDGQVYTVDLGKDFGSRGSPVQVTAKENCRFADFASHPRAPNLVLCVLEDHTNPAPEDVLNSLVCLNTLTAEGSAVFISGSDFYSTPRFNSDGTLLAWTEWTHPDMPWDGEQVFIAAVDVNDGQLHMAPDRLTKLRVAGRQSAISAVQPTWFNANTLMFSCDISGYQNPWISTINQDSTLETRAVLTDPLMLDFADPTWLLGGSNFAVLDEASALFAVSKDGQSVLFIVYTDGTHWEIISPFVNIARMRRVAPGKVVFLGSKVDTGTAIILCSFADSKKPFVPTFTILDKEPELSSFLSDADISRPVPVSLLAPAAGSTELFPLHLVYYVPKNPLYKDLPDEKPPAIVNVHGGPTSIERQNLKLEKQFFTSRGWFWIDVNYTGSSNYGRAYMSDILTLTPSVLISFPYRERLKGNWGVSDVHDCVQAVLHLSSSNLIDPKRVVLRGGSAGGYTTLVALSQSDPALRVFAAGTSSYDVSSLRKLTELTHKFQSRYVQTLVGGNYRDVPEVYHARSPLFHAQNIKTPLLILQGSVDPIVPPSQAQDMIDAIKTGGGTAEYVVFEGESHGWRKAENISKALDLELKFYQRHLL